MTQERTGPLAKEQPVRLPPAVAGRLPGAMAEVLQPWKIRDVVVMRGGRTVLAWHHWGVDLPGPIYSCTKSVLGSLIGIAIAQGVLDGVRQPIAELLPGARQRDERFGEVTVEHLLTMTPGFDWEDFDKPYTEMKKSPDWAAFVMNRPIVHEPGAAFTYNSGGSHLLSAILTRATGESALAYARRRLFEPLEFGRVHWPANKGVNEGGAGLAMTAGDLGKLGQLYANGGMWNGRRVLPEEWAETAVRLHHKGLLHYDPPVYGGYGYHWWVSGKEHNGRADIYFALGYGGQFVFVVPEHELVAVVRKQLAGRHNAMLSKRLLFEFILPAYG